MQYTDKQQSKKGQPVPTDNIYCNFTIYNTLYNTSILGVDQDLRVLSVVPLLKNWYKMCQIYTKIYIHTILYKNSRFKQIIFSK